MKQGQSQKTQQQVSQTPEELSLKVAKIVENPELASLQISLQRELLQQDQRDSQEQVQAKPINKREKKALRKQMTSTTPQGQDKGIKSESNLSSPILNQASKVAGSQTAYKPIKGSEAAPKQTIKKEKNYTRQSKLNQAHDDKTYPTLRSHNIMENLDKVDGACEFFYLMEKENEEIQDQSNPSQVNSSQTSKEPHELPKGYPQKHMYKPPKLCEDKFQTQVVQSEFKGKKEHYLAANEKEKLLVYSNQMNDVPQAQKSKRMKRSNSEEYETLIFEENLKSINDKRKLQRKDEALQPLGLQKEPATKFVSDKQNKAYQSKELDEYLEFCTFVMRSAPVQGNYCGILLRGSHMYKENAFKLLNGYDYNFDLAKFHILYPMVMADPIKKLQIMQAAKDHPEDFEKEVQNALIDLQGCKKDEIDLILTKFREDLKARINDDQLRYHLTALKKIRVTTPADIEEKIKQSLEFSKEIRKKCNIQPGSQKSQINISTDKKLKMQELIDLFEEQKKFSYITPEMLILEQQLEKAKQWQQKAESLRDMKVIHYKTIDIIYQDGKNIPVNFQELMSEVRNRKNKAEILNNKIQDSIIVRKTRQRVGETKRTGRGKDKLSQELDAIPDDNYDKEKELRDLLEEAKAMNLQSDQISKLQTKLSDIDKWKAEVNSLFSNQAGEIENYKRYVTHYKGLLARSTAFQIELKLMKQMQRKCTFIDWRDKIEDLKEKLVKKERITIEQVSQILQEGVDKSFLIKSKKQFSPISSSDELIGDDTILPLFQNFSSLSMVIQAFQVAKTYDRNLRKALETMTGNSSSSGTTSQKEDDSPSSSAENEFETFEKLNELLLEESQVKIEVEKLKDFKQKLQDLQKSEDKCNELISECLNIETDQFKIDSKGQMDQLLEAREEFESKNVTSSSFKKFSEKMLPYIFWINKATRLIKQYSRALGLKNNQLKIYDQIEVENLHVKENEFEKENNFEALNTLCVELQTPRFKFMASTEEGSLLLQILDKTNALKTNFYEMMTQKREEDFDQGKYFKLLENIQNSGLPEEVQVIEEAKIELKREKWIKKFLDLQQMGNKESTQTAVANQDSQTTNQNAGSSHIRIKTIDLLVKEFQTNEDLKKNEECKMLFETLIRQQQMCQAWLDKFNKCFNNQGYFEPKGGQKAINELIKDGEQLELKLKEFVDLQLHQKETSDWLQVTEQIFNNSKTVNLDQLKKHIKDTIDIQETGNEQLVKTLDLLKETVTFWKIFSNTILKIRPIENIHQIVEANEQVSNGKKEQFCICRQPENGSLMLCCDYCDMWFHYICVGLPKDLKLDKLKYKCIGCMIREGKYNSLTGESIPAVSTEVPGESQSNLGLDETEDLLLDLFLAKKRIQENVFDKLIIEGLESIPLLLEEIPQLLFIKSQIQSWKKQVNEQIQIGPQIKDLINSFKKINFTSVDKGKSPLSEEGIQELQAQEKERDEKLILLILQAQSFPVILPLEVQVLSLLFFRDWFRQCLQQYYLFHAKTAKQSKMSKQKFKKDIKKLQVTGEKLMRDLNGQEPLTQQTSQILEVVNNMLKNKTASPFSLEVFEKLCKEQQKEMKVSISLEDMSPDEFQKHFINPQLLIEQPTQTVHHFAPKAQDLFLSQKTQHPNNLQQFVPPNHQAIVISSQEASENVSMPPMMISNSILDAIDLDSQPIISQMRPFIPLSLPINQLSFGGQPQDKNVETLIQICQQIESLESQSDQNGQPIDSNPFLTSWLKKTADYTQEILSFGGQIDNSRTISFIKEGREILNNVTKAKQSLLNLAKKQKN